MYANLAAAAALVATASAQTYQGFNYGATFTSGAAKQTSDFHNEFTTAQNLVGHTGFTSARLYTMIQGGTTNTPISAIQAAIDTKTSLLLGLWGSGGQTGVDNEIAALKSAISSYGTAFTDLIAGISVGSEDLYRITPTGIENKAGIGAGPDEITSYIKQVRQAISGTGAAQAPIGHVDTWTAWVNGSNSEVIQNCDWLGVDSYPYFQTVDANGIENGAALFFEAYDNTTAAAAGKPVWITETGWPVSGAASAQAIASTENAKQYWDDVACKVLGETNTWWYTLQDAEPDTPQPSFGIVTGLSTTPLFDLTCSATNHSSNSNGSSTGSGSSSTGGASSNGASGSGATSSTTASSAGPSNNSGSTSTGSSSTGSSGSTGSSDSGSTGSGSGSTGSGSTGSGSTGSGSAGSGSSSSDSSAPAGYGSGSSSDSSGFSGSGSTSGATGTSGSSSPYASYGAAGPAASYGYPSAGSAASTPKSSPTPGAAYTGAAVVNQPAVAMAGVMGLAALFL